MASSTGSTDFLENVGIHTQEQLPYMDLPEIGMSRRPSTLYSIREGEENADQPRALIEPRMRKVADTFLTTPEPGSTSKSMKGTLWEMYTDILKSWKESEDITDYISAFFEAIAKIVMLPVVIFIGLPIAALIDCSCGPFDFPDGLNVENSSFNELEMAKIPRDTNTLSLSPEERGNWGNLI